MTVARPLAVGDVLAYLGGEGKGRVRGEPALTPVVETPSGKGRGDENFPVGSWLIRRELRPHVHAFYRFAREADDVADNPRSRAEEKLRRLDRMGEVLDGAPGDGCARRRCHARKPARDRRHRAALP